ncbi:unnamed protein product, partial [Ectocarpus sp. 12 AP-2014]
MDKCKVVWKELQGVPLLPLANGTAGSFPTAFALAGRKRFVVGTRRQQGLLPKLTDRFVHLKATRRLARFFERADFLEVMGIVRFSPALLAENLDQVLPRTWRGEKFVGWGGGSAAAQSGGPKASWLALFWTEVSLLDVASVPGLESWPLVPITTGELVSCSMLQQVVRACPSMLNEVKKRGLEVALAAVERAEKAADERDENELQELLARQAQEADPGGEEGDSLEEDNNYDDDDDDDDDQEDGQGTAAAGGVGGPGDAGAEDELESVGDISPVPDDSADAAAAASKQGRQAGETPGTAEAETPPRPPGLPSNNSAVPPPPGTAA